MAFSSRVSPLSSIISWTRDKQRRAKQERQEENLNQGSLSSKSPFTLCKSRKGKKNSMTGSCKSRKGLWGSKFFLGRVREVPRADRDDGNDWGLSVVAGLPEELQLEILSFIYDKISVVESITKCIQGAFPPSISFTTLSSPSKMSSLPSPSSLSTPTRQPYFSNEGCRRYMAHSILQQHGNAERQFQICSPAQTDDADKDAIFCHLCSVPLFYPYRLVDCGHVVCGMCAWRQYDYEGFCSCGVTIQSRPKERKHSLSQKRAYWLLDDDGTCPATV